MPNDVILLRYLYPLGYGVNGSLFALGIRLRPHLTITLRYQQNPLYTYVFCDMAGLYDLLGVYAPSPRCFCSIWYVTAASSPSKASHIGHRTDASPFAEAAGDCAVFPSGSGGRKSAKLRGGGSSGYSSLRTSV